MFDYTSSREVVIMLCCHAEHESLGLESQDHER